MHKCKKYNKRNDPSITVIGEKATLAVNSDTGCIITVHSTRLKLVIRQKCRKRANKRKMFARY